MDPKHLAGEPPLYSVTGIGHPSHIPVKIMVDYVHQGNQRRFKFVLADLTLTGAQ